MTFAEFKKELSGIKYSSKKDWQIFLPFDTKRETLQKILDICKEHLMVDWHVVYGNETVENPSPEIKIFWDRKDLTSTE